MKMTTVIAVAFAAILGTCATEAPAKDLTTVEKSMECYKDLNKTIHTIQEESETAVQDYFLYEFVHTKVDNAFRHTTQERSVNTTQGFGLLYAASMVKNGIITPEDGKRLYERFMDCIGEIEVEQDEKV